MQYFAQAPFDERLEYRNPPGTFLYNEATKTLYLNGTVQFAGTLYIGHIKDSPERGLTTSIRAWRPTTEHKPMQSSSASRRTMRSSSIPSFLPTARCRNKDYGGPMAGDERICPKCHGPTVQAFVGQHPRRRRFVCPNCDLPLEPVKAAKDETNGKEPKPQNNEKPAS